MSPSTDAHCFSCTEICIAPQAPHTYVHRYNMYDAYLMRSLGLSWEVTPHRAAICNGALHLELRSVEIVDWSRSFRSADGRHPCVPEHGLARIQNKIIAERALFDRESTGGVSSVMPCSRVDLLLVCGEHLRQPTWVAHHPDAQPMTQAATASDARSHRRRNCICVFDFPISRIVGICAVAHRTTEQKSFPFSCFLGRTR